MRFDRPDKLYKSLINITERLKNTICDADPEELARLSEEHGKVMDALKASDCRRDPQLLQLVLDLAGLFRVGQDYSRSKYEGHSLNS